MSEITVNWVNVAIDLGSLIVAFLMLYIKICKESKDNKCKRMKLKNQISKVDTEIVPSFNNLSATVQDLTTTIRESSSNSFLATISESVSQDLKPYGVTVPQERNSTCYNRQTKKQNECYGSRLSKASKSRDSSSTRLKPDDFNKASHVEIDLEEISTSEDSDVGCGPTKIGCFGRKNSKPSSSSSHTSDVSGYSPVNKPKEEAISTLFVVYDDVVDVIVYDSNITGYEFANGAVSMNRYHNKRVNLQSHKISDTIRTTLSYRPIESYQIDRNNLNLMFNSVI
jgi:hypothetical protein